MTSRSLGKTKLLEQLSGSSLHLLKCILVLSGCHCQVTKNAQCNSSSDRKDTQHGIVCGFFEEVIRPHRKRVQCLVGEIDAQCCRLSSQISVLEARSNRRHSGLLTSSQGYDYAISNLITEIEDQIFLTLKGLTELEHLRRQELSYLLQLQAFSKAMHSFYVPCSAALLDNLLCVSDLHASLEGHLQEFELPLISNSIYFLSDEVYSMLEYHEITADSRELQPNPLKTSDGTKIESSAAYRINEIRVGVCHIKRKSFLDDVVLCKAQAFFESRKQLRRDTASMKKFRLEGEISDRSYIGRSVSGCASEAFPRARRRLRWISKKQCIEFACNTLVLTQGYNGRSHFCDVVENQAKEFKDVVVLRPSMSIDLSDRHLGAEGDRMLVLVEASLAVVVNILVIIILDDIEKLVNEITWSTSTTKTGLGHALDSTPHLVDGRTCAARQYTCISNLISLLRKRNAKFAGAVQVVLLCAAKECTQGLKNSFDMVCHPKASTEHDQFEILQMNGEPAQRVQSGATRRRSLQCDTIRDIASNVHDPPLQTPDKNTRPKSTRSGTLKVTSISKGNDPKRPPTYLDSKNQPHLHGRFGVNETLSGVNLVIESARALLSINDDASTGHCPPKFPLLGQQAEEALLQLKALIVLPLCRPHTLNNLLYGANAEGEYQALDKKQKSQKTVCGGALLVGPPGSGLSTLARHCAAVAAVEDDATTLIHVSCASLVQKEVGRSEKVIHSLFHLAKCSAPSILILDGLENVGRVRGNDLTTQGTMDRILTTLLMEFDGLNEVQNPEAERQLGVAPNIAVIGIAQHPEWIDPALRRPGRLEKTVELSLPDFETRSMIAKEALQGTAIHIVGDTHVYAQTKEKLCDWIGSQTPGWTALGIQSVCNEAKVFSCQIIHLELPNTNLTFQNFTRNFKLIQSK